MKAGSNSKVNYDTEFVAASNRQITHRWNMKREIPTLEFYINGKLLWAQKDVFTYPSMFDLKAGCDPEFNGPVKEYIDRFAITNFDQPQPKISRKSMTRSSNQVFFEKWGITPSKAMKIVRAIVLKTQYNPIREYDSIFKPFRAFNSKMERKSCTHSKYATSILEHIDKIEEMKSDGQLNLIPYAVVKGKSTKELREMYGKNPWKRISKFSRTHNKELSELPSSVVVALSNKPYSHALLYKRVDRMFGRGHGHSSEIKIAYTDTLLKEKGSYTAAMRTEIIDLHRTSQYIFDLRMRSEIFNPEWSTRRIKEEHDAWDIRQRAILAEKRRIEDAESIVEFATSEPKMFGNVKATILNTVEKIELEGEVMHHCVGNYARQAFKGQYRVVRIEKGSYICTLGLTDNSGPFGVGDYFIGPMKVSFAFQQMYGKYNEHVTDEEIIEVKDDIIKWVNEEYYEFLKGV